MALPDNGYEPHGPFQGAGWTAVLVPGHPNIVGGREIVIQTRYWAAAQRAVDLINGSRVLINGDPDVLAPVHPVAHNEGQPFWMTEAERAAIPDFLISQSWLPTACAVAAKASRRRQWTYAVASYQFSMELFSVHGRDLDPSYPSRFGVSRHPSDHVMFSHAILAAFVAIEHLGLGVPAGPGKPSRIGGAWNPIVLADLRSGCVTRGSTQRGPFSGPRADPSGGSRGSWRYRPGSPLTGQAGSFGIGRCRYRTPSPTATSSGTG